MGLIISLYEKIGVVHCKVRAAIFGQQSPENTPTPVRGLSVYNENSSVDNYCSQLIDDNIK